MNIVDYDSMGSRYQQGGRSSSSTASGASSATLIQRQNVSYKTNVRINPWLEGLRVVPNMDILFNQNSCIYSADELTHQATLRRFYGIPPIESDIPTRTYVEPEESTDYSPPQISNDMASQRNIKAHYKKILERQKVVLLSVITSDDNANESDDEFDDYDYNNQQEDSNRSSTTVISI